MNSSGVLVEKVSSEVHAMWMSWAKNLIEEEKNLSKERVRRWNEECFLPYEDLSEEMKELDRKFAKRILKKIENEIFK